MSDFQIQSVTQKTVQIVYKKIEVYDYTSLTPN